MDVCIEVNIHLYTMGILKTFDGLAERLGAGTADFADNLAEQTRIFACDLWNQYPDQVSRNVNLLSSFIRGYMSRACSDQTLPAPPVVAFTGGQCVGVSYDVSVQIESYNISTCVKIFDVINTYTVTGPVEGIEIETIMPNDAMTSCNGLVNAFVDDVNFVLKSASPDVTVLGSAFYDPSLVSSPPISSATIVGIVRTDGMPDTCGDPPPKYPTTNPNPSTDYTTTVNINVEDGGTLNYNITYLPGDTYFPLIFDVGGIEVEFNLGGINFNFSVIGTNGNPLPLPSGQPAPLPAPADDNKRNFSSETVAEPNDIDYDEEQRMETDPKEEDVGRELEFVRVTLTSVPNNVKNQFGDGAPNVIYAGWFEFQADSYNFPRQPIHFNNNLYRKPPGATGYAYTLYEGISGFATIYKLKQEA